MDHEDVFNHRTIITRGLIISVDDTGCTQTVTVKTHDGVTRSSVEVHQPFGFSSCPPANGGVVALLSNGADPSDIIALPPAVPLGRLGGLQPGESVMYGSDGTQIYVTAGGKIIAKSTSDMNVTAGGKVTVVAATEVDVTAPKVAIAANGAGCSVTGTFAVTGSSTINGNVTIDGNLQVNGNINATGSITP